MGNLNGLIIKKQKIYANLWPLKINYSYLSREDMIQYF
jgi:hypothetical protein